MKIYNWRKNFTAIYSNQEAMFRGKLAFKTKELSWQETDSPVIVLVSIHSAFHTETVGDLKMNALLSTIKNHVKGKITVLLADRAHLQTISLDYKESPALAFEKCLKDARALKIRYQPYFEGCSVVYWHSYITSDANFQAALTFVNNSYETNHTFRTLLDQDAKGTYTYEREEKYSDKALFIEKAREDLLEQCASLLVLSKKGYRFQFYPGAPYASIEYMNSAFISQEAQISWINVFLTMEKKIVIENPPTDQHEADLVS